MEGPGLTQSFSPWGMTTSVPWVLCSPNTCILRNEPGTLGDCVVFVEPHVLPTHHEAHSPCTGYWETLPWESKCLQEAEISAPAIQTQALIRFQVTFWPQHHDSNNNYKHLGGFGCARYMGTIRYGLYSLCFTGEEPSIHPKVTQCQERGSTARFLPCIHASLCLESLTHSQLKHILWKDFFLWRKFLPPLGFPIPCMPLFASMRVHDCHLNWDSWWTCLFLQAHPLKPPDPLGRDSLIHWSNSLLSAQPVVQSLAKCSYSVGAEWRTGKPRLWSPAGGQQCRARCQYLWNLLREDLLSGPEQHKILSFFSQTALHFTLHHTLCWGRGRWKDPEARWMWPVPLKCK